MIILSWKHKRLGNSPRIPEGVPGVCWNFYYQKGLRERIEEMISLSMETSLKNRPHTRRDPTQVERKRPRSVFIQWWLSNNLLQVVSPRLFCLPSWGGFLSLFQIYSTVISLKTSLFSSNWPLLPSLLVTPIFLVLCKYSENGIKQLNGLLLWVIRLPVHSEHNTMCKSNLSLNSW